MTMIDELVENNGAYAAGLEPSHLDVQPSRRLTIVNRPAEPGSVRQP